MSPRQEAKVTFRIAIILCTILFVLYVQGCSTLTGLATGALTSSVTDKEPLVGIDTEVVAGDKQQGVKSGTEAKLEDVQLKDNATLNNSTVGKSTSIDNPTGDINLNEGIPFWQAGVGILLAIMVGLFLPQLRMKIERKR